MRIAKYIFGRKIFKKTERPTLSFDSDDWGVAKVEGDNFDVGVARGLDLFSNPFVYYDSLGNAETLSNIKKILANYSGYNSTVPSFTLNFAAFNPDFKRIRSSFFENYYNIPLESSYSGNDFQLMRSFISGNKEYFDVSFRCAQHINIFHFLLDGKSGEKRVLDSTDVNSTNISESYINNPSGYMDELSALNAEESKVIAKYIFDGVNYMTKIFDVDALGIITPSCGVFDKNTSKLILPFFQYAKTSIVHYKNRRFKLKKRVSISGKTYGLKLVYRLVDFDPTINLERADSYLNAVKKQIKYCFKKKMPVIISTHRLNYSLGHDNGEHSKCSLQMLNRLLKWLVDNFEDIEFLTTRQIIERYRK